MFSKELENLIQATLEDGILEDYEKAALVKRATAEGVDLAELEIYINSLLQKRKKEKEEEENVKQEIIDQRKKAAFGRVCPNCGKQVPPMTLKCECGFEFTNNSQESAVEVLSKKMAGISAGRSLLTSSRTKANEMIDLITTFPVPNTKEDIIELLALSISKSKLTGGIWGTTAGRMKIVGISSVTLFLLGCILCSVGVEVCTNLGYWLCFLGGNIFFWGGIYASLFGQDVITANKLAIAWRDKFEQVLIKGRSLRGDEEFTNQLNYYENLMKKRFLS